MMDAGVKGRWLFAASATAVVAALGISHEAAQGGLPASLSQAPTVGLESQSGANPSVSSDGRFVVYAGPPASTDDDRTSTVWLRDRSNGGEVELTKPQPGVRLGDSVLPVISGDGCYAAVLTQMPLDLFRDDDNGNRWDVYRVKLPSCGGTLNGWELISTNDFRGDDQGASDDVDPRFPPAVSGAGSVIAYTHSFDASQNDLSGVIVVDLTKPIGTPGHSIAVAGTPIAAPNGPYKYAGLREPSVSDDGIFVAFTSDANSSKATPDWSSGQVPGEFASSQVYVWNRLNPDVNTAVVRASLGPDSTANGDASAPAISADGTYVAFQSTAVNLVIGASLPACVDSCPPQIYRYNRVDGTIVLVSRVPASLSAQIVGSDLGATQPAISSDGSQVAFVTRATNLLPTRPNVGGSATDGDIVVSNVDVAEIYRASVQPDGVTPAPAANAHPKLSATGRVLVFDTLAGGAYNPLAAQPTSLRQVVGITQQPQLSIADINLGTGIVGLPGGEWFVRLYNAGPGSFVPSKVQSTNPQFGITFGECTEGYAVPPGGSCGVAVILTPSGEGPLGGLIKISETGFGALSVQSQITGAGGLPALAADQGSYHHFDTLKVGESSDVNTFTVSNVSLVPAWVTNVAIQGADPKDFRIVRTKCRGAVLEISAGCTVDVAYSPKQAGHSSATIVVATDTGQYTSVLVDGDAHYTPTIQAAGTDVVAGKEIGVGGSGFAPDATITLLWADGAGRRTTVQADKAGNFLISMLVAANERPGDRMLVAQTPGFGTDPASVVMRVIPRPVEDIDAASPDWPGN